MKKLLDGTLPIPNSGVMNSPVAAMALALSNLSRDITEYLRWTRTDVTHVPADHWLVSYLIIASGKLGYRPDLSPMESFNRTDFLTEELSRTFGFTTEYNAGRLHIGDNGSVTVYVVGKSPRRSQITMNTPYWAMTAVRYLAHSSTSLAMGNHAEPEDLIGSGYDVIELDLGILHYQVTRFTEYWLSHNPESPRSLQQFVAMDVLPKLKQSQYDIAIMNRLTAMVNHVPVSMTVPRLPKSFPDRHREMDNALMMHLDFVMGRELSFEMAIGFLPTTLGNNPFKVLSFDEYLPTRQMGWALLITRFNLLSYLFTICRVDRDRSRRWPIGEIKRAIKRIDNDSGLGVVLNLSARKEFRAKLQALLSMTE